MATKRKVTSLNPVVEIADSDVLHIVDASDPSHSAEGTSKKATLGQIKEYIATTLVVTGDKSFSLDFNASSVVVNHNLNKRPSVTVINSAGDEVEGDIVYNSLNQLTLTFSGSFVGTVYCN